MSKTFSAENNAPNTVTTISTGTGITVTDSGVGGNHAYSVKSTGESAMPDRNKFISLSLDSSYKVISPYDGYFQINAIPIDRSKAILYVTSSHIVVTCTTSSDRINLHANIPVKKGEDIAVFGDSVSDISCSLVCLVGVEIDP